MAENGLSERVDRIEQKLDKQFIEVQEHFVEQRKYMSLPTTSWTSASTAGFSRVDRARRATWTSEWQQGFSFWTSA